MNIRLKLSVAACMAGLPVPVVVAQTVTAGAANEPTQSIVFDVVSVKTNKTDVAHPGSVIRPDGLDAENIGLVWVLCWAYGFSDHSPDHFSGLPDWAKSEHFDIIAKVAPQDVPAWNRMSLDEQLRMFRSVMADRFKMKIHAEAHERPVFALTVAKGGPKMRPVKPPANDPHGFVEPHDRGWEIGHHATVEQLRVFLSTLHLGRDVQDRTGLTGNYDFTLKYSPVSAASSGEGEASTPDGYPFIFTALPEQLGLRLEPTTGTVETLGVDHIERPSEN